MLPLAIWLFLIGYTIAITGKRNLALSYKPQADGSIKPVDGKGSPAKTYSLMDVVTCGEPPAAPGARSAPGTAPTLPPLPVAPERLLQPQRNPQPQVVGPIFILAPRPKPPGVPIPKPPLPNPLSIGFWDQVLNGLRAVFHL